MNSRPAVDRLLECLMANSEVTKSQNIKAQIALNEINQFHQNQITGGGSADRLNEKEHGHDKNEPE